MDIVGLTNVGLFVNSIQAGSVAEVCGQIQEGDQVMEVNGISCGKKSVISVPVCAHASPGEGLSRKVCWVLLEFIILILKLTVPFLQTPNTVQTRNLHFFHVNQFL